MTRKKLFKLSLITLAIGLGLLAVAYFFFHFVTDAGVTFKWNPEPGKPFVTDMIGQLAVLFLFSSSISALSAVVLFDKDNGES